MPDEIDLLRTFRGDTPGPGEVAWGKARAAIMEVAEPVRAAEPPRSEPRLRSMPRFRPGFRSRLSFRPLPRRRTAIIAGAIAVAAAVVAGGLVSVLPRSPGPSLRAPLSTAWQPARALPSGPAGVAAGVAAPSGHWRLTSYLSTRGWQEYTTSPRQAGGLTCPTSLTCYVEGNGATSDTGPADLDALYVSTDDARTWSVLPVPAGVTFTSALACTTASDCAAGGLYYDHQGVYLSTANGGHSWRVTPLGAGADQIIDLACESATSCRGLLETSTAGPWGPVAALRVSLISTADGGWHFTTSPFPAGTSMQSLSCPTAAHCVAYGIDLPRPGAPEGQSDADTGVVLVTGDGGASWRRVTLPRYVGVAVPEVTCADAAHCALLGYVMGSGTETFPDGDQGPNEWSVVGFSSDGGRSWSIRKLPENIRDPFLESLACPTALLCYATGQDGIEQKVGNAIVDGSAVIAVTRDGGQNWRPVRFAIPAKTPGGMTANFSVIAEIQCPAADACVAMGSYLQGSMSSVPIYTNGG